VRRRVHVCVCVCVMCVCVGGGGRVSVSSCMNSADASSAALKESIVTLSSQMRKRKRLFGFFGLS
jgi:hypothetical protein